MSAEIIYLEYYKRKKDRDTQSAIETSKKKHPSQCQPNHQGENGERETEE